MKRVQIIRDVVVAEVFKDKRHLGSKEFSYSDLNFFEFMFLDESKQREKLLIKAHKWADTLLNQAYKYEEEPIDIKDIQ